MPPVFVIAVINGAVVIFPYATSGVENLAGVNESVLQGGHERNEFKGGSRLITAGMSQRIVVNFIIMSGGHPSQICDGLDFAGFHFHQDGCAPFGIAGFQLSLQGTLGNVLESYVERGHDIHAVLGFYFNPAHPAAREFLAVAYAGFTFQESFKSLLDSCISGTSAGSAAGPPVHGSDGS